MSTAAEFIAKFAMKTIVLTAALLLTACASMKEVSSQVTSVSKLDAIAAGTSYRFERPLLQQAGAAAIPGTPDAAFQDRLEAWAKDALSLVGLQQQGFSATSAPAAPYTVQVSTTIRRQTAALDPLHTWPYPGGSMVMVHSGVGGARFGYGMGYRWGYPFPYHPYGYDDGRRTSEVSVVMRDTSNGRVVFESKAQHYGFAMAADTLYPALFKAALSGFPKPPEGVRKVVIDLPAKS